MFDDLPEPHPLDYDWRFNERSIKSIIVEAEKYNKICGLGVPSVIKKFDEISRNAILIDRQPLHSCKNKITIDINIEKPIDDLFECVLLDPPWYLNTFLRWISWASIITQKGGIILCSLWPENTRPIAKKERSILFNWLSTWSEFTIKKNYFEYKMPLFEKMARVSSQGTGNGSPLFGDLISIKKKGIISLQPMINNKEEWVRFSFDNYQIAVRNNGHSAKIPHILKHPDANGWIWPSVSTRAIGRNKIDIWSSRNEVAIVDGNNELIQLLREINNQEERKELFNSSFLFPFKEWDFSKINFERRTEWLHLV